MRSFALLYIQPLLEVNILHNLIISHTSTMDDTQRMANTETAKLKNFPPRRTALPNCPQESEQRKKVASARRSNWEQGKKQGGRGRK